MTLSLHRATLYLSFAIFVRWTWRNKRRLPALNRSNSIDESRLRKIKRKFQVNLIKFISDITKSSKAATPLYTTTHMLEEVIQIKIQNTCSAFANCIAALGIIPVVSAMLRSSLNSRSNTARKSRNLSFRKQYSTIPQVPRYRKDETLSPSKNNWRKTVVAKNRMVNFNTIISTAHYPHIW